MGFHSVQNAPSGLKTAGKGAVVAGPAEPLAVSVNHRKELERDGRTTVVVLNPFSYFHEGTGRTIVVSPAYVTDFASMPRIARWIIPPFGRHAIAAVVHDWLYSVGQPGLRAEADGIFRDALMELQVGAARVQAMHAAVRAFGGEAYDRAARDWTNAFMDWRTGSRIDPPASREAFFDDAVPADLSPVI
jgi:hypothetical protein